jgi:hypothetical protein
MSGTYPSSPGFTAVGFKTKNYNMSSETISGRIQVRNIGSSRFEFSASYPPMTASEFNPVLAFITAQQGMKETFQITLPEVSYKNGNASGTVRVNNTDGVALGTSTIPVDGLTGTLKAGDMIKFAGHSKVYMITSDLTGAGDLLISPTLQSAVADDEVITYDAVQFTVRLNNSIQEYDIGVTGLRTFDVDFIEVT